MAKGTLTLRDVPEDLRFRRAEKARQQIREHLEHPALTEEQRQRLQAQLGWVSRWEKGDVPLPSPTLIENRRGQEHVVVVTERLSVITKV